MCANNCRKIQSFRKAIMPLVFLKDLNFCKLFNFTVFYLSYVIFLFF